MLFYLSCCCTNIKWSLAIRFKVRMWCSNSWTYFSHSLSMNADSMYVLQIIGGLKTRICQKKLKNLEIGLWVFLIIWWTIWLCTLFLWWHYYYIFHHSHVTQRENLLAILWFIISYKWFPQWKRVKLYYFEVGCLKEITRVAIENQVSPRCQVIFGCSNAV